MNTKYHLIVYHFFGQNLKTIRLDKKLSQAELGKQFNKGQKTIGNWETGYSEPCMDDLLLISHFFDIDIDSLLKTEIKRGTVKAKAGRNRHREDNLTIEKAPPGITAIKRDMQQSAKHSNTAEAGEIIWRDKYIAVLENHLFETVTHAASGEVIHNLATQVMALQKVVAGLAGTNAAATGNSMVS